LEVIVVSLRTRINGGDKINPPRPIPSSQGRSERHPACRRARLCSSGHGGLDQRCMLPLGVPALLCAYHDGVGAHKRWDVVPEPYPPRRCTGRRGRSEAVPPAAEPISDLAGAAGWTKGAHSLLGVPALLRTYPHRRARNHGRGDGNHAVLTIGRRFTAHQRRLYL
jgi:hypothetical protein